MPTRDTPDEQLRDDSSMAVHASGDLAVSPEPSVVETVELGRRMIRDLEAFLSAALRASTGAAWLPRRRIAGCDGASCERCLDVGGGVKSRDVSIEVSEVESC